MTSKKILPKRGGFTLIEVALATAIISIAAIALMVGVGSSTRINSAGRSLAQAVILAENIRELSIKLPYFDPDLSEQGTIGPEAGETVIDDLDDLHQSFTTVIDSQGNTISGMPRWRQVVTVQWVDDSDLTTVSGIVKDTVMVAVDVRLNLKPVYSTSWLVAKRQ